MEVDPSAETTCVITLQRSVQEQQTYSAHQLSEHRSALGARRLTLFGFCLGPLHFRSTLITLRSDCTRDLFRSDYFSLSFLRWFSMDLLLIVSQIVDWWEVIISTKRATARMLRYVCTAVAAPASRRCADNDGSLAASFSFSHCDFKPTLQPADSEL